MRRSRLRQRRAGKVVFCEKPLANTVKEAERMLAAVEQAGVLHMICHNYRRAPAVMLAKELIARGELGEIRHFRGTYLQDWITDPKFPLVWRLDRTAGWVRRARGHRRALDRSGAVPGWRDRVGRRPSRDVHQDAAAARTIRTVRAR